MSIYRVTGNPTSIASAANTELLQGLATSSGGFDVRRFKVGQLTTETLTGIVWQFNKYTGAFTPGSGGTAKTPAKGRTGQAGAISTWLELNPTKITGGTLVNQTNYTMQDVTGDDDLDLPDCFIRVGPNEALQILLVTALGVSTNLTYTLVIEELFA